MKKNLLFLAIALIIALPALRAQITITRPDFPEIGELVINGVDNTTPINPGQPGLNQTWDFSNLVSTGFDSVYYITNAGAPNSQNYPDANIATNHNPQSYPNGYNMNYWNFSETAIKAVGDESLVNLFLTYYMAFHLKYTPSAIQLPLPFTYNSSNNQSFVLDWITAVRMNGATTDSSRTISHTNMNILADASGTMILPDGSFPVLRVKETWNSIDSSFTWSGSSWTFDSDTTSSWTQYRWYANGIGEVGFYKNDSKKGSDFTFFKSLTIVGMNDLSQDQKVNVYPNPATSVLNISSDAPAGNIQVIDQNGKVVLQFHDIKTLDISTLPAGNYLIRIESGNRVISKKVTKM